VENHDKERRWVWDGAGWGRSGGVVRDKGGGVGMDDEGKREEGVGGGEETGMWYQ